MTQTIIVVGAGAAGLMAARELSNQKMNVIILESRNEIGGRIRTIELPDKSGVVEAGAEFIHGNLPITLGLCKEANLDCVPVAGRMYRRRNNKWVEQEEMFEGWDELIKKMGSLQEDTTLNEFLSAHYSGDKYADLRRNIIGYAEGFDLGDPAKLSVRSIAGEWSHEEQETYRIRDGYGKLASFLEARCVENGCSIVRGDAVKQIDWQKNEVTAYTASGKKYRGEKVIVTVPIGVLTNIAGSSSINFTPPIDDHIRAAADIGFGSVVRVVIQFRNPIWKPDTSFILSDEAIPTWWTQNSLNNNILTGWAGGPRATYLSQHTDAELFDIALNALSHIFELEPEEIRNNIVVSYVFNWKEYADVWGAYSYPTTKTTKARKILSSPLENTVFFAGEGVYEGDSPGTVEAALANGKQVAAQLTEAGH